MFLNKERLPGLPVIDEASQRTTFRENLEHAATLVTLNYSILLMYVKRARMSPCDTSGMSPN